jgi:ABC-type sugar transport system ATPase subunit
MFPSRSCEVGEAVFEVEGLTTSYLKNVSFNVRKSEVVGLFGLMGAGRSEVARCIIGDQKPDASTMVMEGKSFVNKSPADSINRGISYIPAERKTEGLNLTASVKENITISNLKSFVHLGKMNLKREAEIARQWVQKLDIRTSGVTTETQTLSGGNQQKVVIAKNLNTEPQFMILNEPTRGVDVGAKVEIYNLINRFCYEGKAVLMISSELPEIMALSDRIYVIWEGEIVGEFEKNEFSQEVLLKYAMGEAQ